MAAEKTAKIAKREAAKARAALTHEGDVEARQQLAAEEATKSLEARETSLRSEAESLAARASEIDIKLARSQQIGNNLLTLC